MRLSDWLKKEGRSGTDLANAIGRDDSTVNRLLPGEGKKQTRKPSRGLIEKIAFATRGEVLANDCMDHDPAFYASAEASSDNGASARNPSQLQHNSPTRNRKRNETKDASRFLLGHLELVGSMTASFRSPCCEHLVSPMHGYECGLIRFVPPR